MHWLVLFATSQSPANLNSDGRIRIIRHRLRMRRITCCVVKHSLLLQVLLRIRLQARLKVGRTRNWFCSPSLCVTCEEYQSKKRIAKKRIAKKTKSAKGLGYVCGN